MSSFEKANAFLSAPRNPVFQVLAHSLLLPKVLWFQCSHSPIVQCQTVDCARGKHCWWETKLGP